MNTWYEIVVKSKKAGEVKVVTEKYLMDALSFTEAEKRAYEELAPYYTEIKVAKINPVKVSEIFFAENADLWFKCKVNFITLIEKTGKEKKTPCYMYVNANNPKEAEANLTEGMKGTLSDWNVEAITETKIIDVIKFNLEKASNDILKQEGE